MSEPGEQLVGSGSFRMDPARMLAKLKDPLRALLEEEVSVRRRQLARGLLGALRFSGISITSGRADTRWRWDAASLGEASLSRVDPGEASSDATVVHVSDVLALNRLKAADRVQRSCALCPLRIEREEGWPRRWLPLPPVPATSLAVEFELVRRAGYAGKDIVARGYFRRAPVPYLELRSIECAGQTSKCWTLEARFLFGLAALIGGLWLRFVL